MSKTCSKCQAANRDDARRCGQCGSPLPEKSAATGMCPSGRHVMDPGWDKCPYCSSPGPVDIQAPRYPDLPSPPGGASGRKATAVESEGSTAMEGSGGSRTPQMPPPLSNSGGRKTTFMAADNDPLSPNPASGARRLLAILVTYTWRPTGQLFPVWEGRNYLGRDRDCEISLEDDPQMSGKHAVIIYRGNHFWIDDEKSMNGTYLNGEEVAEKRKMTNYSAIRTGSTVWTFIFIEPEQA